MSGIDKTNASYRQAEGVRHRSQLTVIPFNSAIILQELIMKAAKAENTAPSALAQLARAWSELEERKRIIKMKPLPKAIDVTPRKRQARPPAAFVELPQAQVEPPKTT